MQVGDMKIVDAIVNLEVQVAFQTKIIEKILDKTGTFLPQGDIDSMRKEAQKMVAEKYPQLGIRFN